MLRVSLCLPKVSARECHHGIRNVPFARARYGPFLQDPPKLENLYLASEVMRGYLERHLPEEMFVEVDKDLKRFGNRTAKEIWVLSREAEEKQPSLKQFDAWGRRNDRVITCSAWKELKAIGIEEGLVASAYERRHGEWSRLYQISKGFLFHPSSAFVSCPFAMSDGAAKTIEALKLHKIPELGEAYKKLTSRDRNGFWTSGQWMTERGGGSDVANGTETVAVLQDNGKYKLYGYKWFSSAIDADMTLTLARIMEPDGTTIKGTKGLSMFFAKLRDDDGSLNNMEVMKLKNKLGTRQLPTAEMLLDGVDATLVSDAGRGVACISHMLTVTRLQSGVGAVSPARRLLQLARDYSTRRKAFGQLVMHSPLHMQTLARLETEVRGGELFTLEVARLLGRDDSGVISKQDSLLLRLLTPVYKAYYAKSMVGVCAELIESFGGQGYIEDTGIPTLMRDAQVHSIWEGTTNVLSLDVLRALSKTQGEAVRAFRERVLEMMTNARPRLVELGLDSCRERVLSALSQLIDSAARASPEHMMAGARDFTFSLAEIYSGALLLDHASWSSSPNDIHAAERWCSRNMAPFVVAMDIGHYDVKAFDADSRLVMAGHSQESIKGDLV